MLDAATLSIVIPVVVGGVALGAGFLAGRRAAAPSVEEAKRLRGELERAAQDHAAYKASVDGHFRKTAELVGQMTQSYAAVYDHLAGGAQRFCDDAGTDARIPFGPLPEALSSPVIEAAVEDVVESPVVSASEDAVSEVEAMEFGDTETSDSEAMDLGPEAAMRAAGDGGVSVESTSETTTAPGKPLH